MSINFYSSTGETVPFEIYDYHDDWHRNVAGLYIFAKYDFFHNRWQVFYVGKTECFKSRMADHEKWPAAVRLGSEKVLAVVASEEWKRSLLESELINCFRPVLNKQLNPSNSKCTTAGILRYRK